MSKLHKIVASTAVLTAVSVGFTSLAGADIYTVKKGDTLWDIAIKNGTTVEQLMRDNNLTSSLIFPGDQLSYQSVSTQIVKAESNGHYTVVLGDTLYKIANKFGTTVDALVKVNKISNPNLIMVGQALNVNPNAQATSAVAAPVVKSETKATTSVSSTNVAAQTAANAKAAAEAKAAADAKAKAEAEAKAAADAKAKAEAEAKAAADAKAKAEAQAKAKAAADAKAKAEAEAKAAAEAKAKAEAAAQAQAKAKQPAATPVVTPAVSNKGAAILAAAQAQLGRYQDCTMLVTNALKAVGINYHGWPAGYLSLGTVVPASQAQPGDLIYYANGGMGLAHIAVYAGNGQAVHGGWNGNQTVVATANLGSGPVYIRVA